MIITKDSHLDHGLTGGHLALILERFADVESFRIETIDIPDELPALKCALFGPAMGDPPVVEDWVQYAPRGSRTGLSRMMRCTDECCIARPTRKLSVIMGPHEGQTILYTAFGGPVAPREPFDPSLDDAGRAESKAFWSEHALAAELPSEERKP